MKTLEATPPMNTTRPAPLNLKHKLSLLCAVFATVASPALHAADVYWVSDSGTWFTPNGWLDAVPSGNLRNAPDATDGANIYRGTVDIDLGVSAASATASIGHWVGELATVNLAGYWENAGIFDIGASQEGLLNIASTGTLANGGAATLGFASDAIGTAVVAGHWRSGETIIGGGGTGVFTLGSTGTALTAQINIGRDATATGTAIIYGYWENSVNAYSRVGHAGNGTLIIKDGGYLSLNGGLTVGTNDNSTGYLEVEGGGTLYFNNRNFYLGDAGASSGTAVIAGSVSNVNTFYVGNNTTSNNTLIIAEGGSLVTRANSFLSRRATADLNIISGTNSAYIAGLWDTGGALHIGANAGHGILDIASTGTVFARTTGIRITYYHPDATAYVNVDGYIEAAGGYIIVAHYGDSYMRVGATGTAIAGTYISIGQGDSNASYPPNPLTASGSMDVLGYVKAGTYLQVGNRLKATLNLASTGTIEAGTYLRMSNQSAATISSTANIAGYLKIGSSADVAYGANTFAHLNIQGGGTVIIGTYLNNGRLAASTGCIDIASSASLTVGGNYTQNSLSTLGIGLDIDRVNIDNPELTVPTLSIGGAAALSGTLSVQGSAVATIPEFEYDDNGYAQASTLTGIPIFRASGGITNDFVTVDIEGLTIPDTLPDFIRGGGLKVNEGGPVDTRYDIGYGLAWRSGITSAHGTFTIDDGKTFEVDIQLSDRPGIIFESGWDGMSLTKSGPGTLILSVENAYTGVTTIEDGDLIFAGPWSHTIGELVNNSVVDLGGTGQRLLTASSLAGTGTYRLTANLHDGTGDHIAITGDEPMITLLSIGGVNDISHESDVTISGTAFQGSFDYGVFKYAVEMRGNNLVIVNTGLDPVVFDTIRGVPGAQSLLWFDQQDNLNRRLGELRAPRESGTGFDIWARAHAANTTIGGGSTEMRMSDVDLWGAEAGVDYTWRFNGDSLTTGAFVGYNSAAQNFKSVPYAASATGDSDLLSIGAYAAWLAEPGWFVHSALTASNYKNKFDAVDLSYNHATGNYKDRGFGVTVEVGHRFDITKGWFVEPAVQGAAVRLIRGNYTTGGGSDAGGLSVHGASSTVTRVRGAVRVGRTWSFGNGQWLEVAGRGGVTRERSTGGEVNIGSANRWRPNLDGERFEAGVGVFWKPFKGGQLHFDYEYASGDNYKKPWGISLGFRLFL